MMMEAKMVIHLMDFDNGRKEVVFIWLIILKV
jgi:hypothetical protein